MRNGLALLLPFFIATTFAIVNTHGEQRVNHPEIQEFNAFRIGGKHPRFPYNVRSHPNFPKKRDLPEICKKDNHIIESAGDLYVLGVQCGNISGSITLSNYQDSIIDFGELESINGDIIIENSPSVVKIQGRKLKRARGSFIIKNLTSLVAIELPELKHINAIEWKVVPILTNARLNNDVEGLNKIIISDSSLATINGFQKIGELEILDINNNRYLEHINTNVKKITKQLRIHANAKDLELELPELKTAQNITIRDTSSIGLSKLEKVENSLEFIENQVSQLDLSNLKSIGGTLGIMQNRFLSNLDFGNVTDINGGLVVANNSHLEKIDFLQKLKQIGGAIYFEGKFQDTDFPQLRLVKGSAFIKSNSVSMDCNKWITPLDGRAIIRGGKLLCISGRKQRTQNISEDGKVLDESESGNNNNDKKKQKNDGKNRHGVLNKITSSGNSAFEKLNMIWLITITWSICFIPAFLLG